MTTLATDIPAGNVSGTWSPAGSPYVVNGHIRIPAGESLTIEPGTEIQFSGPYYLRILGTLTAGSAGADTVVFTSTATNITWRGFKLDSVATTSDTARFNTCRITRMYNTGIVVLNTGKLKVENCRIHHNTQLWSASMFITNAYAVVINNYFHNNTGGSGTSGGAMYIYDSSPLVEGNTFRYNSAPYGDCAISIWRNNLPTAPIIRNNVFDNNDCAGGGGIGVHSNCVPLIEGNIFSNNNVTATAGAIWIAYVQAGEIQVRDNIFSNNSASSEAGAVKVIDSRVNFENNLFSGNTANGSGGGVFIDDEADVRISDCEFYGNDVNGSGSGVFVQSYSDLQMNRCLFRNNDGYAGPLGMYAHVTANVTNCVFVNNNGQYNGGAVSITLQSSPVFSNCVFANNEGALSGAMYLYHNADPTLNNCIFWGNRSAGLVSNVTVQDYIWHYCNPSFNNCVVEGGLSSFTMGTSSVNAYENCVETDPMFVNPTASPGWLTDASSAFWNVDGVNSPCIDAGTGTIESLDLGDYDFGGGIRMVGASLDIGAYEGGYIPLLADLNGDMVVNTTDLLIMMAGFGCLSDCGVADINGDGVVTMADVLTFLAYW
ncbi:MAG: right-handed parallel beta-helix repeat-containing protein [Flavobacteriales bacterium]|nr:right-handed parallel beta-helix repeat-containing protein [Flavobacteriales bacterium]